MVKLIISVCLLAVTSLLNAQSEINSNRQGFLFGFSSGVSNLKVNFPDQSESFTDLALNWKMGYSLRPKLALLVSGTVSIYDYSLSDRPRKRDFGGIFPSVQVWVADKIWVSGGVGIGTDAPVFYDLRPDNKGETDYYSGWGLVASTGYDLYKKNNFTVDLQARMNYSKVNLPIGKTSGFSVGLLVGINFY